MSDKTEYEILARRTWRHSDVVPADKNGGMQELIRYAVLAPSSHNTQPWRFELARDSITVLPDLSRRCPIVDPDDHHLFISLGCAVENLVQAARATGLETTSAFDASRDALIVRMEQGKPIASALFDAIPRRQCTRAEFDGAALSNHELELLERAAAVEGVRVVVLTDKRSLEGVLEYVVQGNSAQLSDPAFVDELKTWIRFSDGEALRTRDGLFSRASGNPSIPRWLGSPMFSLIVSAKTENEKYARQIRSSAGIAVFATDASGKEDWTNTGRSYERFALQAAALNIRNAFVNQPVEVANLRAQFANSIGIGKYRPDLVVRFGRGPEMARSLRRPIEAVIA